MDSIEFNCQQCDTLLRVKQQDQGKLIRCPNCEHLQRYIDRESFRAVDVEKPDRAQAGLGSAPTGEEAWSLRTETGREIHGLSRTEFEHLLRQGHADTQAFFIGGDHRQWTSVHKLFHSATGTTRNQQSSNVVPGASTQPTAGWNHPSSIRPSPPLRMEQQLPDGYGTYVMILGLVSLVTYCFPLIGIIGLILGTVDTIRLGNGDISGRYKNRLIIGMLCCLFSIFVFSCTSCRIRL